MIRFRLIIFSILIFLPAFGFSLDSSLTLDQSKSEMRPYIQLFTADLEALDRYYSIPFAESRIKRFTAFYDDWLTRINQINFDGLSPEGKVDYILFENYLHFQKYKLERQQKSFREIEALIPLAAEIINLEESRKKIEKIEPPRVAELLSRISVNLESLKIQLETERPKSFLAFRAARVIDSLKEILKNWYEFYHGYDPLFTWWVEKPYAEAVTALEKYSTFLRDKIIGVKKGEITGEPVGREALIKELSFEMIPYTPEELIEIATKEMAWCEKMMIQASREMGFDSDWKKALEKVKREHVEPGQQAMLVKELALEAIDFLEKNNLITIPSLAKEIWRMEMMTPEQQLVNPFFTGGEVIRVSFPTDTMSHEAKLMSMRGNNIHFARATVHHELIPGHHLQGFMNARLKPYRRIFRTPFWTEGWALYWEMLLWDLGFPRTPENRMGMLFWRMHRCARVIFSLNFHLGKWSPQECIDFLVNRVGHERANAEAEVRRSFEGEYGPLYQLAYLIGALQFRALEKELVKTGRMTYREFHDAILMENNIPVEILRAILKKDTLRRDFRSTWKFYDGQIQ
jgi:uncharacterized protein (DUF885 family)